MEELRCDILILGGGGAGLFAALHAADAAPELRVVLATKALLGKGGCTRMVQGGYNAVLDPRDSIWAHFEDTLKGGEFLNDQELVWILVNEAPRRIRELETRVGCFFDRNSDGTIHQKPFAGQSFDRTVHRGDLTGIEIVSRLVDQVLARPSVRVLEECRAVELLEDQPGERIAGALLLDIRRGQFIVARAKAVLCATGGGARMYKFSSPSVEKSGDGVAMAYRAGATLMDMEMLQLHPTGLLAGDSILTGSVLEEGLRGVGARLYNALGERFMERYDPQRLERSTRDRVARAIYLEIMEGRGTPNGGVYLDVSHLGAEFVERNFPGMVRRVRMVGRDLAREPVEVAPTAHFHMGGIRIDTFCRTTLEGLFAAGEDAAGVQGANRLGGNGVAESTVFGALAGDVMAEFVQGRPLPKISSKRVDELVELLTAPLRQPPVESPYKIRRELEMLMWEKVGVVRHGRALTEALEVIRGLRKRQERLGVSGSPEYNLAWNEVLNLRNLLTVAELVATSALARTESRGSHFRSDYPERNDAEWLCNICVSRGSDGTPVMSTRPVELTRLKPAGAGVPGPIGERR